MIEKYKDKFTKIDSGCWVWNGSNNGCGYGEIRLNNKKKYAHRLFYEWTHGKIPDGLVIDHLCRNPSCVNPDHLEPVTPKENTLRGDGAKPKPYLRKEYCKNGHKLTPENRYSRPDGRGDNCRECVKIRAREYARRKFGWSAKI
jgi:hypothetical protein